MAPAAQLFAQGLKVVDLAVVDDPSALAVGHGHVTGGAEIDDREAVRAETDTPEILDAAVIRAPMDLQVAHASYQAAVILATPLPRQTNESRNSAHSSPPPPLPVLAASPGDSAPT